MLSSKSTQTWRVTTREWKRQTCQLSRCRQETPGIKLCLPVSRCVIYLSWYVVTGQQLFGCSKTTCNETWTTFLQKPRTATNGSETYEICYGFAMRCSMDFPTETRKHLLVFVDIILRFITKLRLPKNESIS